MPERWLSADEIGMHLGVNPDAIYKWITRKSMPAHKLGRLPKIIASEVDEWVRHVSSACHVTMPIPATSSGIRDKHDRSGVADFLKTNIHVNPLFRFRRLNLH